MASSRNPNLVTDIIALTLEIPESDGGNLKELQKLILKLPADVKAERDAHSATINTISAERDTLRAEVDRCDEQISRLRNEVAHMEHQLRQGGKRQAVLPAVAARRLNGSVERVEGSEAIDPYRRTSEDTARANLEHEHRNRAADQRRSKFDERPRPHGGTPRGPAVSKGTDSYRPSSSTSAKRHASDASSSQPSKHARWSSSQDALALDRFHALLKARLPVCGACKKRGRDHSCDGKPECRTCQGLRNVVCSYRFCRLDRECVDPDCTYLHSHQWDEKRENAERIVKEQGGNFISRKETR